MRIRNTTNPGHDQGHKALELRMPTSHKKPAKETSPAPRFETWCLEKANLVETTTVVSERTRAKRNRFAKL